MMPSRTIRFDYPREEREAMVASMEAAIQVACRKAAKAVPGFNREDREDLAQELRMMLWQATEKFDKARGVKWATYCWPVIDKHVAGVISARLNRPKQQGDNYDFDAVVDPASPQLANYEDDEPAGEDTETELHEAVRRRLTQPLMDRLTDKQFELVSEVVESGLSPAQIAEQRGFPVKTVKLLLKNAVKSALATRSKKQLRALLRDLDADSLAALKRSAPDLAAAVELLIDDHGSYSDVAKAAGVTSALLRTRLTRALEKLAA